LFLGKSRRARSELKALGGFYTKMLNKWWEAYDGEQNVLIEDVGLDMEWIGNFLKIWADRYGFRCEIKNDSTVLRPERIYVTSNHHPKEIFKDLSTVQAILDRFEVVEVLFDELAMDEDVIDVDAVPVAKKPKLMHQNAIMFDVVKDMAAARDTNAGNPCDLIDMNVENAAAILAPQGLAADHSWAEDHGLKCKDCHHWVMDCHCDL